MEPGAPDISFDRKFVRNMMESGLRIGLVFILLYLTYDIVRPFVTPIAWGGIIAIAAFPLTRQMEGWLGGRRRVAASLVTVLMILVLVVPFYSVSEALVAGGKSLTAQFQAGQLELPGPPESVRSWPLVGERFYQGWSYAHDNLREVATKLAPQLKSFAAQGVSAVGRGLASIVVLLVSLLIAGAFMAYAEPCERMARQFCIRLGGRSPGGDWAPMIVKTIRSVLQGIVGVAVIQAGLCAIGLFVMGIPGAPIWSALILLLAVAQLPTILVVAPIIIYAFSAYGTTSAILFTVWMMAAGLSDNVLKPLLMGRGLDIPMPIILVGSIGGMIASGVIGLFVGAVILSVWYKLFQLWLEQTELQP